MQTWSIMWLEAVPSWVINISAKGLSKPMTDNELDWMMATIPPPPPPPKILQTRNLSTSMLQSLLPLKTITTTEPPWGYNPCPIKTNKSLSSVEDTSHSVLWATCIRDEGHCSKAELQEPGVPGLLGEPGSQHLLLQLQAKFPCWQMQEAFVRLAAGPSAESETFWCPVGTVGNREETQFFLHPHFWEQDF